MAKMEKVDGPKFAAWSHENLAKFADDAYWRMREQQDAMRAIRYSAVEAEEIHAKHSSGTALNI